MRLFRAPDGVVDWRERVNWLTAPFDISWRPTPDERWGQAVLLGYWGHAAAIAPLAGTEGWLLAAPVEQGVDGQARAGAAQIGLLDWLLADAVAVGAR